MELSSMLAGEEFTDHPRSVCPVIAAFMRKYNDSIDNKRRQDLYAYASKAVGTRVKLGIELARERRCIAWGCQMRGLKRPRMLRRIWWLWDKPVYGGPDNAGRFAALSIKYHTDQTHAAALAFIDELIAIGADRREQPTLTMPVVQPAELVTTTT